MPAQKSTRPKRWSLRPDQHNKVFRSLRQDNLTYSFYDADDESSCIKTYDTNIQGRFICTNKSCTSPGWSSNMVAITIRLYSGQRYNARVYHQQCATCQRLSRPILNASYVERVVYRIKKWAGIDVEAPPYAAADNRRPHHSDLCEGCRAGHCQQLQG